MTTKTANVIYSKRILVTGITSIHGWPIWNALKKRLPASNLMGICPPKTKKDLGDNVVAMCMTDPSKLKEIKQSFAPEIVVHCAGVCDLDLCQGRPRWAYDINVNGSKAIAENFADTCQIYYMSTDLVFSGNTPPPDGYTEQCTVDPVSVVGETFAEAEQVLFNTAEACIVRLGLPLGDSVTGDKGAIDWVKKRLTKNRPVTLFYDELRSCPSCDQIGEMILAVLKLQLKGLYHFGGNRIWSLHEIGEHVRDTHNCPAKLLKGISRHEEVGGPPRVGDISMNCARLKKIFTDADVMIENFNA